MNIDTGVTLEEGLPQYEMQAAIGQQLTNKGFTQPAQPTVRTEGGAIVVFDGKVPANLQDMTDNDLGFWLGLTTEYLHYVNWCLAEAQMNRNAAEKEMNMVSAKLFLSYKHDENGKKCIEKEREAKMEVDSRFVEAQSRALYFEGYHRFIQAIQKGAEQTYNAISRRITQRGQDLERDRRTGGVQSYQGPPQFRRPGM
jgi:hypothetical protein